MQGGAIVLLYSVQKAPLLPAVMKQECVFSLKTDESLSLEIQYNVLPIAVVPICRLYSSLDNPQVHSLITAFTYKKSHCMEKVPLNRAEQEEMALNYTKSMQVRH